MSQPSNVHAACFALVLAGALAGCAAYSKCGLRGCADDAKVTAQVRAQLDQYPALSGANSVRVHTIDNVVYLYGQVDTDMQRQLAESVAVQATGGAQVVDSISVSNASR